MSSPHALVDALHRQLALPPVDPAELGFVGADPVLPTRFRVGEAAAAALAACALAAARIWRLRGGGAQRVQVDVSGAAASLVGFLFQRRLDGGQDPGGDVMARLQRPLSALYRTRDGAHVQLHASFPDSTARTLELLGCADATDAIAASVARWDAQALEDALAERGLCGVRVRTQDEWRQSPQGRAIAPLGAVEVLRIGDSAPEPFAAASRPLEDVRVLDLTRVLAGPTAGRTLAAHGARVLRIGSPTLPTVPAFVMETGHGKRFAHLDLKHAADRERLLELVGDADVFTQGYRLGAMARLGLGPETLAAHRPGLVYTSINCYGHEGPWAARPGWEQLAQAATGLAHEHGGDTPRLLPAAATDYNTGYLAALGTLVALERRAREGGSYHVRVSLAQTAMWLQDLPRTDAPGAGLDPGAFRAFLVERDTPYGRLSHLGPIVELSETPARWELPTAPAGSHPPSFR